MGIKLAFCFRRREKKYLINREQYEQILSVLPDYMLPDVYEHYKISNIYYDTENWQLIRASIDKPAYKEKLRVRSYGVPGDDDNVFVELKKKFDGDVFKRRIVTTAAAAPLYLAGAQVLSDGGQISREIDWFQQFYRAYPRVYIGYDRQAFAGIENKELRITFDTDFRWRDYDLDLRDGEHGEKFVSDEKVLMEIKIPGTTPFWLSHMLSEKGVFPNSFSKYGYCYKTCLMNKESKGRLMYV